MRAEVEARAEAGAAAEVAVADGPRGWRWLAAVVSLLFVAAVLAPAFRQPQRDSFPLSNYPMFSSVRDKPWVHVVVAFDADDGLHRVAPKLIANAEVMQAAETVRKQIRRGKARQLCRRVAARLAETPGGEQLVRVEVQSRQFDPRAYFVTEDGHEPLRVKRRARCAIEASAGVEAGAGGGERG